MSGQPRLTKREREEIETAQDALDWARDKSAREAWEQCPRGDWLLWIAARVGVDRTLIVRAAARCAETALPHAGSTEPAARTAIEAALRWADAPTPEHAEAARVAYRVSTAAARSVKSTDDAAAAAYAAAYAARAVGDVVADLAAYHAACATDDRAAAHQQHADIVREIIPYAAVEQAYLALYGPKSPD